MGQNLVGRSGTEKVSPAQVSSFNSLNFMYKYFHIFYELLTNVLFLHLFQS